MMLPYFTMQSLHGFELEGENYLIGSIDYRNPAINEYEAETGDTASN